MINNDDAFFLSFLSEFVVGQQGFAAKCHRYTKDARIFCAMQLKTLVRSFKTVDKALLNHASELIVAAREEYRTLPVVDNIGLSEQKKSLEELRLPNKVPMKSIGSSTDVLDAISYDVLDTSTQLYHPGFIAHMDPPTAPIAIAAGMMQIATNQNLLHPDVAPKAREIEKRVIEWLAPYYFMEGGSYCSR